MGGIIVWLARVLKRFSDEEWLGSLVVRRLG
jgi:hypothetical protein